MYVCIVIVMAPIALLIILVRKDLYPPLRIVIVCIPLLHCIYYCELNASYTIIKNVTLCISILNEIMLYHNNPYAMQYHNKQYYDMRCYTFMISIILVISFSSLSLS